MASDTRNIYEVIYWFAYLALVALTAYYVKTSAIKAVEAGRKLNDEQNKDNAKRNLFLTLYSYRGSPASQDFVDGLNRIDILFHGHNEVIDVWHRLYDSMQLPEDEPETDMHRKRWELLRLEMFDKMANVLGYHHLKQVDMMKHYYSKGQEHRDISEWELRDAVANYNKSGFVLFDKMLRNMEAAEQANLEAEPTETPTK